MLYFELHRQRPCVQIKIARYTCPFLDFVGLVVAPPSPGLVCACVRVFVLTRLLGWFAGRVKNKISARDDVRSSLSFFPVSQAKVKENVFVWASVPSYAGERDTIRVKGWGKEKAARPRLFHSVHSTLRASLLCVSVCPSFLSPRTFVFRSRCP